MAIAPVVIPKSLLPKRLKNPPAWLFPQNAENAFVRFMKKNVGELFEESVDVILKPLLPRLVQAARVVRPDSAGVRVDALVDEVAQLMAILTQSLEPNQPAVDREALDVGVAVASTNKQQMRKIMNSVLGVDVFTQETFLAEQVDLFRAQNVDLVKGLKQKGVQDLNGIVQRGLQSGLRVEEIEKQINAKVKGIVSNAKLIARDQVAKLNGQITQMRQESIGVTRYKWRTVKDERVRDSHRAMDGKTCVWSDPTLYINSDGKKRKRSGLDPAGVALHPGQDFQCLPGDSVLDLSCGAQMLFRRRYAGKLTTLVMDSGVTLRATPNHPVLTTAGWRAIDSLEVGDDIVEARDKAVPVCKHDIGHPVATFAEVFDSLAAVFGSVRVPGGAAQFHGDGTDDEIDVVDACGLLPAIGNPLQTQSICERFLADANATIPDSFAGFCKRFEMLDRSRFASEGALRGLHMIDALLGCELAHAESTGLAPAAWFDAMLVKASDYEGPGYAVLVRELQNAHASSEVSKEGFLRHLLAIVSGASLAAASVMPESAELEAEIVGVHAADKPDLLQAPSFARKPGRIIEKLGGEFEGHVYNLQSLQGYYVAQSCVVHNCRCTASPVLDDLIGDI